MNNKNEITITIDQEIPAGGTVHIRTSCPADEGVDMIQSIKKTIAELMPKKLTDE